jgi:hypothetical protein
MSEIAGHRGSPAVNQARHAASVLQAVTRTEGPRETKPVRRNKLVIRLLPPTLGEDEFSNLVCEWINDDTCEYRYFVAGHVSTKGSKLPIHSRAYAGFKDLTMLQTFVGEFKKKIAPQLEGNPIVEYAPYQNRLKSSRPDESMAGTIYNDPVYQSFLAHLKDPSLTLVPLVSEKKKPTTSVDKGKAKLESSRAKGGNVASSSGSVAPVSSTRLSGRVESVIPQKSEGEKAKRPRSRAKKEKPLQEKPTVARTDEQQPKPTSSSPTVSNQPESSSKKPPRRPKKKPADKKPSAKPDEATIKPAAKRTTVSGEKPESSEPKPKPRRPRRPRSAPDKPNENAVVNE